MFVKLGNKLFHIRNFLFPVFYAVLFIPSPSVFQNEKWALITGSLLIFSGILTRFITIGLVYIIRGGSKRQIYAETLVTDGIYRICRNPMYLGNILLLTGFGFFANSLLFMLVCIPLFLLFYYSIICAEEEFLQTKFGSQFINYKSVTNAIIPKLGNIKEAFEGHTFRFKVAVFKEYNSLFLYFTGLLLLLYFQGHITTGLFGIFEIVLLLSYLLIRMLKYNKL
ncbi:MAG TPA: isoprenylcysteine carboxylmethyltransferase family protein [Bacteroidales bacterium]|jgi:protein-S-isoprenylcysteine O-methyltransferase Ste14|nr:isoprenylcysteine carboxylmethyltransferase family protein [Bacteroidales bacterium]